MRRFLGTTNPSINTGTSSTPACSIDISPSPAAVETTPLSSTKRAFQQTFGQLSYSRSNGSSSSASSRPGNASNHPRRQKQLPSVSLSLPDNGTQEDIAATPPCPASAVPPTPPCKHGHGTDNDHDGHEAAWDDDARSLPFGTSSLSRAPSQQGRIGRASSGNGKDAATYSSEHATSNGDSTVVLQDSQAGKRTSTATISASRYGDELSPQMAHSPATAYDNRGPGSLSSSQLSQPYNHTGLTVSATYAANASSLVDLKDEMMLELLSSDALIHVAQFEILGFDEVEELRKEHSILSNRLQSLQNKLAIETKIRDAALSISRLYSTKRLSLRQKQHAEEELHNSNKKVELLSNEVNKLSKKEMEIKSRILRHMAAVLALSFRKLEAGHQHAYSNGGFGNTPASSASQDVAYFPSKSDNGTAPSSAASSHTGPCTPLSGTFPKPLNNFISNSKTSVQGKQGLLSPTALYSPTFSTASSSSRNKKVQAFAGPHFFANNKDAIVPGASTSLLASTSASTRPSTPNPSNPSASRSPSFSHLALFASSASTTSRSHTPSLSQTSSVADQVMLSPVPSTHSTTLGYMDTSQLDKQIQDLTTQLAQSHSHSSDLQSTIDLLKQEKGELASRLEEFASDGMKEKDKILKELNDQQVEVRKLRDDLQRAHHTLEENMKDAALWEEESRRLQDGFEFERKDMANRLKGTLAKYLDGNRMHISRYLPQSDELRMLDMSRFLDRDLDDMLSTMNNAQARLTDEVTKLQQQLSAYEETSKEATNKTADEIRSSKEQIDQFHKEKQVLIEKITRMESEAMGLKSSLNELSDEKNNMKARYEALNERYEISASQQLDSERRMAQKIKEVDKVHTERMLEKEKLLHGADLDKKNLKNKFDTLQSELVQMNNEKSALLRTLQEVWKSMPSESAMQARLALKDSDDITKYKAVWLSTASSSTLQDGKEVFKPEILKHRIQSILKSDETLISRLASHEDHAASHKAASIRAEKLLQESKASLQAYHKQVKELEERIELMNKKEVEMLERLNDLSLALETSRSNHKRSESSLQELEKKCAALGKEKDNLEKRIVNLEKEKEDLVNENDYKVKITNLQKESAELRDELTSAQDELDELRSRESRQRVQLLDELTQLTEEASSLRAQLRTAQRKLATAGK